MFSKVFAVRILLFLSISSFVHCAIWEPQNTVQEQVCRSETCLKRGKEYFDSLNPAVNPCDDFYSFACGGWHVENKPPEYLPEWSTHDVMEKRIIKDLREILEKPSRSSDPELTQIKYFYDVCMKQPFLGRLNPNDVGAHILKVGRFGSKSIWDIHEQYMRLTGESAFFDYTTYVYRPNDLIPLLYLREVESAYGSIYHNEWKPGEVKHYSQFLFMLMKSIKLPTIDSILRDKVKAVLQFRQHLNQFSTGSKKRGVKKIKPKTAHDFEQWVRDPVKLKHSGMPWEKIVKNILSVVPPHVQNLAITSMRESQYFRDLERLLASTSQEVLVDHMEMYFAERHTIFTPTWEDLLERSMIEPSDLVQPIRQDVPRYVSCIRGINMWPQIGKLLQQKWFRKDITQPMTELVNDLKMAIASQVKDSTWLKQVTKAETIKRIVDIQSWIGYPPWYNDPSTDLQSEAAENDPLLAEAYLDIQKFVIYIKSPLLRSPFYDPDMPNLYNLGGIGYVVGHELYHVINDCGVYATERARLVWWPPEMHHRCSIQMKCFVDTYNSETQREFQLTYHEKIKGGNRASYLEDFPDVMGLDAAFRLYQALKKKDVKVCQTLPRFEKYSCEQMFFISYANTKCGKLTSKAAKNQIETSRHSLDSVRVNGAVMNNKEFAKAFKCPKAKPMNPDIKCNLWT